MAQPEVIQLLAIGSSGEVESVAGLATPASPVKITAIAPATAGIQIIHTGTGSYIDFYEFCRRLKMPPGYQISLCGSLLLSSDWEPIDIETSCDAPAYISVSDASFIVSSIARMGESASDMLPQFS